MDVLTQYSAVRSVGFKSKRRFTSLEHLNSFLQRCALQLFYELVSVILLLREGRAVSRCNKTSKFRIDCCVK